MGLDPEPEVERYAASLPRTGERPLHDDEGRAVVKRVRLVRVQQWGTLVGLAATAAGTLSLRPWLEPTLVERIGGSPGLVLCAAGFVGGAICLFAGRSVWQVLTAALSLYLLIVAGAGELLPRLYVPGPTLTWFAVLGVVLLGNSYLAIRLWQRARLLRLRRRIAEDLVDGVVESFAGAVADARSDETLRRLSASGALAGGEGVSHQLEVLPRSGVVLRANGRALPWLEAAHVVNVAPSLPHAFRAELPQGLAPAGKGPSIRLKRRSLSPAEREELAAHIARLRARYWPSLLATAAVGIVVVVQLADGWQLERLLSITALGWYGLAAFTYAGYARRVLAARKLEFDRKLRWVVTVDDLDAHRDGPTPPKLEVLPVSQLAWTENAEPAGWRISRL